MNKTAQIVEGAAGGAFHLEGIYPSIDGGRFAVKRIVGERVEVWADIYRDGHDVTAASLVWRRDSEHEWRRAPMAHYSDDRWVGSFVPDEIGRYSYAIEAWTDDFATWRHAFELKQKAGADVTLDAIEGAGMLTKAQASRPDATAIILRSCEQFLRAGDTAALLTDELKEAMAESQFRGDLTRSQLFPLVVDRPRARYGTWYLMAVRSHATTPGRHGKLRDCIARLPDIEAMGFDVICLAPIYPIGRTQGGAEGGQDAVHPELGTLEDFRDLVAACASRGIEVGLDFAVQCSPDHPWLREHPRWFKRRPDGSIRRAESSPGTCEDIVTPDFSCEDAGSLWNALRDVVLVWVERGVRIFRVENPHTTPFRFWGWLIKDIQRQHPDVIFLAEALTRPKLMKGLAKLGFTQSRTLFTCTQKSELEQYLGELTCYPEHDFCRPNVLVNPPDVMLTDLQSGEPRMFKSRAALAGTLSSNYGICNGFELLEPAPIPGRDEHLDSENYQAKVRDWNKPGNIKPYIGDLNRIRRDNPALQQTANLRFIEVDDGNVIAFVKQSADQTNTVAVAIALSGEIHEFWLPLGDTKVQVGGERRHVVAVENLMTGEQSALDWGGIKVRIEPDGEPALFFRCLA